MATHIISEYHAKIRRSRVPGLTISYEGWVNKAQQWRVRYAGTAAYISASSPEQRRDAGFVIQELLRQYSPKLSGRLSRRWRVVVLKGQALVRLRNPQPYAHYQDVATRNRGYIRRALRAAWPDFYDIIVRDKPLDLGFLLQPRPGSTPQPLPTYIPPSRRDP